MALKLNDGTWCAESSVLEKEAVNFFKTLYTEETPGSGQEAATWAGSVLSEEDRVLLGAPVSVEKVQEAVFSMGPFKAPGPDGLQPVFYQQCWEVVGPSVVEMVQQAFYQGQIPDGINNTLISSFQKLIILIPLPIFGLFRYVMCL